MRSGLDARGVAGLIPENGKPAPRPMGLSDILSEIWPFRLWILLGTLPFLITGVLYAHFAKPSYYSQAILASKPQANAGGGAALLSQLGGMGGMLSTQFGMTGSNIDRLQILLNSHDIIESVLVAHDLPARLQKGARGPQPSRKQLVESIRDGFLSVTTNQKLKVLYLGITAPDSVLAKDMVDYFIEAVSRRIKNQAQRESENNRRFLEEQLMNTSDPLVREKIQQLIGVEIEKAILIGSESFDVLETPQVPLYKSRPKRSQIIFLSGVLGLFFSCAAALTVSRLRKAPKSG